MWAAQQDGWHLLVAVMFELEASAYELIIPGSQLRQGPP